MQTAVLKFGGSTINSEQKLDTACSTVGYFIDEGYKVVAVFSAFRGVTDTLRNTLGRIGDPNFDECFSECVQGIRKYCPHSIEGLSEDLYKELKYFIKSGKSPWKRDEIEVKGERLASRISIDRLRAYGIYTELIDFGDTRSPLKVLGDYGNARVDLARTKEACQKLKENLELVDCVCLPGYGGEDVDSNRVKTLRRGGSDIVATALSYGLSADALWIITDINGIKRAFTDNIRNPPTIPVLTVNEIRDAGMYGAKLPNENAVDPLMKHCPKKTYIAKFDDIEGEKTRVLISKDKEEMNPVELVASRVVIVYTFEGTNLHMKVSSLENELGKKHIDFKSLGGSDYTRGIAIPPDQRSYVDKVIKENYPNVDISKSKEALVGIVGEGMKYEPGTIVQRLGTALKERNIAAHNQTDLFSPISCGVTIDAENEKSLVESLYDEFGLDKLRYPRL